MTLNLDSLTPTDTQRYLQHAVAPRPVCFASTINAAGNPNVSPFSFFNLFSIHPPIVIFSPSRRLRNNTVKHTLENVREVPEVVINLVTTELVQQVSLASCEYPGEVNEFIKAGFTPQAATFVRPPMVKESPVKLECRVQQILSLGEEGGAGQLVICRVVAMHFDEGLMGRDGFPDQQKLDLVARLGGDWYCRVLPGLFKVAKPNTNLGIGIDRLPLSVQESPVLTGHELAQLANVEEIPLADADEQAKAISCWHSSQAVASETSNQFHHQAAKFLISKGKIGWAWQVLLPFDNVKSL